MAEQLQLKVVAEGIEHLAQSEFLVKKHCTLLQGFYYSKPVPAEEVQYLIGEKYYNNSKAIPLFPKAQTA